MKSNVEQHYAFATELKGATNVAVKKVKLFIKVKIETSRKEDIIKRHGGIFLAAYEHAS